MKAPHLFVVATMAACLGGHSVSLAQDDPAKPTPVEEKPAADPAAQAESDKKARAILAKAAEHQNAGDLAEAGKLESFHVVFFSARFKRERTNDKGESVWDEVETDDDGLVVDWKQGSIKTQVTINGATTTKAKKMPEDASWIFDGQTVSSLTGDRKADVEQLAFHLRVVDQLLEVAILGKLVTDKSRWRALDDATVPKTVAIQRLPTPEAPDIVRITLWIESAGDGAFGDVVQASMPPTEKGGATLTYVFSYRPDLVAVRRKGADGTIAAAGLRFPHKIQVYERRDGDKDRREMLSATVRAVDINTVVDADFAKPKAKAGK